MPTERPMTGDSGQPTLSADELARRRPLIAFTAVAILLPVFAIVLATAVQLSLLGSLPDQIAMHWNLAGEPDRWAPAWSLPLTTAVLGLLTVALITAPAVRPLAQGDGGWVYRVLGGTSLGVVVLLTILFTATAWYQTDGRTVPVAGVVGVAALAAVACGAVAAALLPIPPAGADRAAVASGLSLAPDERAAWLRTTAASTGTAALAVGGFVLALLTTIYTWATGESTGAVVGAAVVTLLILLAIAMTVAFRVRVDERGLTVSSVAGLPRLRVPLEDIVEVRVNPEVRPLGDYGGYGIRRIGTRTGVVPRRGPAIVVERTNGRSFGVVVDDAETGATLLAALVDRAKQSGR
ncbi:DUF1648 domain-containing protein [Gordonia phosphorivorans]|uniref:DUF1648 domain-containing protein n=1 Tax=Gordonia phosphorivorans TaxID=1056982 RepID=A0ABV6H5M3_9ACTN